MARSLVSAAALAAVLLCPLAAASSIPTCGPNNPCPADSPCCSQYGQCGVGAYCLGGCDPLFSHSLDSCVPAPVCDASSFQIDNLDGVVDIEKYLGDATKANYVATGSPLSYNGGVLLTMAQDTVGTLLASTHYVWYGKISAKLRTSQGAGVVTAFIMMSDARDEIDFEFVGVDTAHAQSNFYSQGVTDYNNGDNLTVSSDTVQNEHEYTIDWQPDSLTWSVDGKVLRTLERSTTWNATANRFDYPQTPSRVMLSLWPAGIPSNAEGTIEWAGGLVDWSSPYMQNGYYYASISSVTVECYDPPAGANITGSKSYVYNNEAGTNNTVAITNDLDILASFYATGENPGENPNAKSPSSSGSATKTGAGSKSTSTDPETVPGVSGAGSRGDSGFGLGADSPSSSASASAGASSGGSSSSGGTFSQGGSSSSSNNSGAAAGIKVVGATAVVTLIAAVASLLIL